jgi:hypothetical protein
MESDRVAWGSGRQRTVMAGEATRRAGSRRKHPWCTSAAPREGTSLRVIPHTEPQQQCPRWSHSSASRS